MLLGGAQIPDPSQSQMSFPMQLSFPLRSTHLTSKGLMKNPALSLDIRLLKRIKSVRRACFYTSSKLMILLLISQFSISFLYPYLGPRVIFFFWHSHFAGWEVAGRNTHLLWSFEVHLGPRTASVAVPNEPLPSLPTAFQGATKHYNDLSRFC